jgi:molybdenum-dependent DNA-binding transcriptional regulator ModE
VYISRPLLDRLHGGKGGGTTLTPEGRSVLRKADEIERAY